MAHLQKMVISPSNPQSINPIYSISEKQSVSILYENEEEMAVESDGLGEEENGWFGENGQ